MDFLPANPSKLIYFTLKRDRRKTSGFALSSVAEKM